MENTMFIRRFTETEAEENSAYEEAKDLWLGGVPESVVLARLCVKYARRLSADHVAFLAEEALNFISEDLTTSGEV
jgi:hypothetical protein